MRLLSSLLVKVGRRTVVTLGVMTVFAASVANAQTPATPPAAAPAQAPAPAPPDPLKFGSDTAVIIIQVKADKTADFESAFADMRALLAASTNEDMKTLNSSITCYKVDAPAPPAGAPAGPAIYLLYANPVLKTMSYDLTKILYFTTPAPPDAPAGAQGEYVFKREITDPIFAKLKDAIGTINPWPLKKIGS